MLKKWIIACLAIGLWLQACVPNDHNDTEVGDQLLQAAEQGDMATSIN